MSGLREGPPRSILFVPGSRIELAAKAAALADAVCIDLEDAVEPAARPAARRALAEGVAAVRQAGTAVLVRINAEAAEHGLDIDALPGPVDALVVAKAAGAGHLHGIVQRLAAGGLGAVPLVPMIEDLAGLDAFAGLGEADGQSLAGITIGCEDLAADLGCAVQGVAMEHAFYRLAECARRLRVPLLGYPGSIAGFADLDGYRALAEVGAAMGAVGGFCIHPRQVAVLNAVFSPDPAALAKARQVVAAYQAAGGGAVALDGRMVDRPVVLRAQALLARAERFSA